MHIKDAYTLISDKLSGWIEFIIAMLPNAIVAIIVVIVFYFIAKIIRNLTGKILNKAFDTKSLNDFLQTVVHVSIIAVGLFIALEVLDLHKTVTSLLAGVGVIGLALGFAFQDTAANFVAGVFLAVRSPIEIGDIIESVNVNGVVHRINLMATEVKTFQGINVVIPNKEVFQNPLFNYTQNGTRRIELSCGVSYNEDLDFVKKITIESIRSTKGINSKKDILFYYTNFGDSSINFQITVWTTNADQVHFLETQSNMIVSIKKAFDKNGISIPFPIRTLDFGNTGEDLSKVVSKVNDKHSSEG